MLKMAISTELLKLKRSRIWIVMLCIPLVCIVLGLLNFSLNREVLVDFGDNEWIQAWTQIGMLYSMFLLPILISIYSSLICRNEHVANNWNKLLTMPIPIANIHIAKLIVIAMLSLATQVFLLALYIILGNALGFSHAFPIVIVKWIFQAWIGTVSIAALQLLLSTSFKSFSIPVGIGVAFTFLGIPFYLLDLGYIWAFAYPSVAMDPINLIGIQGLGNTFLFYFLNILYISLFSFIGIRRMKTRDVK